MTLPAPTMCSLQMVDDVVAERQNGRNADFFSGIAEDWRSRVQAYIDSAGSPANVPRWRDIEPKKNSFLNLYLSPADGSAQGKMLLDLKAHNLNLCPACGEAGAPNTLDHYLPKGKYPHFCVTPYNLYPMCDACQLRKLEKTGDADNSRFFLHPYFDVFVAEQVLSLAIHPPFNTPTFSLSAEDDLSPEQKTLVSRHVKELEIAERYGRFFREQHRRILRLVSDMRISGQDIAATLKGFRNAAESPSKNAWDHVFYSAILETPEFVTYLESAELPDYL